MKLHKILADLEIRFGSPPMWASDAWPNIMQRGYWQGLTDRYLDDISTKCYLNTARQYAAVHHRNLAKGDRTDTCLSTWPLVALDHRVDRMRKMLDSRPLWIDGSQHPVLRSPQVYDYIGLLCVLAAWRSESFEEGAKLLQLANRFHRVNDLLPNMARTAVEHLELALSMLFEMPEEEVILHRFSGENTDRPTAPRLGLFQALVFSFRRNLHGMQMWRVLWEKVIVGSILEGLGTFAIGLCGLIGWCFGASWTWFYLLLWCPLRNAIWRRDIMSQLHLQYEERIKQREAEGA